MSREKKLGLFVGFLLGVIATLIVAGLLSYLAISKAENKLVQVKALAEQLKKDYAAKDAEHMARDLSGLDGLMNSREKAREAILFASGYGSMADFYSKNGQPEKAKEAFIQALNVIDANPNTIEPKFEAELKSGYASTLDEKGEYIEAEKYIRQAYNAAVKAKDKNSEVLATQDLAGILTDQNTFAEADVENQKAIKLYEEQRDKINISLAWMDDSVAYNAAMSKDLNKAIELGNKALVVAVAAKDKNMQSAILDTIGEAYYQTGDFERAENYFLQSVNTAGEKDDVSKFSTGIRYKHLAMAQVKLAKLKEACGNLKISNKAYKYIDAQKDLNEIKGYEADAHCQ